MKKLFAIILAMALLLCGAAMADEAATEISGRWELSGMTRGNQTVDAAALEAAGMTMIFDLYADGTVDAVNGNEQIPGEWTVSGNCVTISLEGDPLDFYLVNGQLQSDDSIGFVMILTRTGDVEQADETAIPGRWELTSMAQGNQVVDAAALEAAGMTMIFDLYADGTLDAVSGNAQMPGEWTVSGNCVTISLEGDPLDFYLVDGQLQSDDSIGFVMTLTRTGDVEQAAAPEDLVGRWELTGAIMGEEVKDAGALAEMGVTMTVELYADGSASGENGFTLAEGSWAADGETVTITLAGSEMPFLLQDGQLRSNDGSDEVIILTRTGDVEEVVLTGVAAQFVGHWVLTSMAMDGEVKEAEELAAAGLTMIIDLHADGTAWANNGYEQLTGLWMAVGTHVTVTIDDDPLDFYLVDGHLESDGSRGFVMTLTRVEE